MHYEDRITIPTPEGVSLELTLAGLGSRAVSGSIDFAFKLLLLVCLLVVLSIALGDGAAIVLLPSALLAMLIYDVGFETLAGGRTPGKRMSGLRVVRSSGRPVDGIASTIRNALRLIDGLPLMYVPTIVGILSTKRNQRPGDLAADTVVIRDRRAIDVAHGRAVPGAPAGDPFGTGPRWDVSAITAEDTAAVRAFLERRSALDSPARARLAAQLDTALRPRVVGADERDPERFLEILYDAKRSAR